MTSPRNYIPLLLVALMFALSASAQPVLTSGTPVLPGERTGATGVSGTSHATVGQLPGDANAGEPRSKPRSKQGDRDP